MRNLRRHGWPRSRDLETELPGLLRVLTERLGSLARLGLDAGAWDAHPHHLVVDGHLIRIDWSEAGDGTIPRCCLLPCLALLLASWSVSCPARQARSVPKVTLLPLVMSQAIRRNSPTKANIATSAE
ncbi:DUF5994 family protein [Streptomyces sp. Ac-502]|uniref:DUF5994 family protein n=1 Tax=Streptomyces sp. Ac-502 TaxID=3342801 RepID=UPI003862C9CF